MAPKNNKSFKNNLRGKGARMFASPTARAPAAAATAQTPEPSTNRTPQPAPSPRPAAAQPNMRGSPAQPGAIPRIPRMNISPEEMEAVLDLFRRAGPGGIDMSRFTPGAMGHIVSVRPQTQQTHAASDDPDAPPQYPGRSPSPSVQETPDQSGHPADCQCQQQREGVETQAGRPSVASAVPKHASPPPYEPPSDISNPEVHQFCAPTHKHREDPARR